MVEHMGSHKLSPPPSLAQARVECTPQTKAPGREKPLPIMLHIFLGPGQLEICTSVTMWQEKVPAQGKQTAPKIHWWVSAVPPLT